MALPFKIISQTPFDAITLDEAKAQCRLMSSFTLDDTYITSLITVAASSAQEYLHWLTSVGIVKEFTASAGTFKLNGKFIDSIDEVTATDGYGDEQTLTSEEYSFNVVTDEITIPNNFFNIYITYTCGASSVQLPPVAKQAMLMLISTMYNNREDFITGLTVAKMPMSSIQLLSTVRTYVS